MTDYRTPCQEGDADAWFIGRDGRQYADDELIPAERLESLKADIATVAKVSGLSGVDLVQVIDQDVAEAEEEIRKAALIRRRQARDACHNDCRARLQCLSAALDTRAFYGTWGGYYEEQLREINRLRDQRAAQRGE